MLPDITFLDGRWFSWDELIAIWDRRPEFEQSGVYVIGNFPSGAPPLVDAAHKDVVYIGETHGRTASLGQRLRQFGASAGFLEGGQVDGHYAAWRLPTLRGLKVEERQVVTADGFYVAVCPYVVRPEWRACPDARGTFPPLVESMLLWQYVLANRELPCLNNSGRQRTASDHAARASMQALIRDADVVVLLDPTSPLTSLHAAAGRIANAIASAWGYAPKGFGTWSDGAHDAVFRHVGGRSSLYVGRHTGGAFVSGWRDHEVCEFGRLEVEDERASPTVEGFRALVDTLWDRWR